MAYLDNDYEGFDDESITALLESDDGGGWASSGEAVGPRYVRNTGRNGATNVPRPQPPRPVGGLGGATLNTPAGRAQMKFEKPVATKESVDAAIRELKGELAAVAATVKKVDETVDKNTAILDKKVLALELIQKKGQQGSQMAMILPLLLSTPPELASVTLKSTTGTSPQDQSFTVSASKYKDNNNTVLLIALLAMSGGFGGGGNGNDSMSMMLPLLLLSGGLGGSK